MGKMRDPSLTNGRELSGVVVVCVRLHTLFVIIQKLSFANCLVISREYVELRLSLGTLHDRGL